MKDKGKLVNKTKMIDYILTALIPLLLLVVVLYGSRPAADQSGFMNKDYTTVLKAACCIIVILVHIPAAHANKLQDGIGSFAYICVTLFFLMSAFGMSLSAERKPGYMAHFWRNRLAALLIPQLLINTVSVVLNNVTTGGGAALFHLNNYVAVLLGYCLWFWIVYQGRRFYQPPTASCLLIAGVVVLSLLSYCLGHFYGFGTYWCYERYGLVWGLVLFLALPKVKQWVNPKTGKIIVYTMAGLILGAAYLKFKSVFFYGEYLLKVVLGVSLILLVFTLSSKRTFGNKAVSYLGGISYEVYLSHGFIMGVLNRFCPEMSSGVFILSTVIFTIIFSALIHSVGKPLVKMCRAK